MNGIDNEAELRADAEVLCDMHASCEDHTVSPPLPPIADDRKPPDKPSISRREVYRRLLVLAIPIALQNFLSALLNIIDSTMVQSLGEPQMGAVLLVNQFIFIYQVVIFAIAGASVVFISQFYGKGDTKRVSPVFFLACIMVVFVAVGFTLVSYFAPSWLLNVFFNPNSATVLSEGTRFLKAVSWSFLPFGIATLIGISLRGMQKVIMPLVVSASVIGINFFFNFTFMFGKFGFPNLGIEGAAVGTVIARAAEMLVLIAVVVIRKYPIFARPSVMCRITKDYIKKYIKLFLPACANEIFWVLGTSIYLMVFSQLSNSESILAAVNITQSIDKLLFVVLVGLGNAAGVVVGNEIGAGNDERAKIAGRYSVSFATFVGIAVGLLTMLMTLIVPFIYPNTSLESIKHAQYLMLIFGVFLVARARTFTLIVGVLRAGGDTIFCMLIESVTIWLVAVPIALLTGLVFHWPIEAIYACIYSEEIIKMVVVNMRFKRGKWMKNLVQNLN